MEYVGVRSEFLMRKQSAEHMFAWGAAGKMYYDQRITRAGLIAEMD